MTSASSHVFDALGSPGGNRVGDEVVTRDEGDAALVDVEPHSTVPCRINTHPIDSSEEIDALRRVPELDDEIRIEEIFDGAID